MILKVSGDLKKLDVYANGVELASIMGKDRQNGKRVITYSPSEKQLVYSFKNPVLMTDTYKICFLDQAMRDTLFSLYSSMPRTVEYDGVSVSWNNTIHVNVWCPSIDTVLYAKALKKLFNKRKKFDEVIEIGTGSGFLAKYALEKAKINEIWINDINPYAIKCARDNIEDKRATFVVGDGLRLLKNRKFDLIICNPPYVPRPQSIDENPYEGVSLLHHLLHNAQDYLKPGGIMVTNISSLAEAIVMEEKPKLDIELLEKMEVPLKVNNIMNNKGWLDYLKKKGLVTRKDNKKGYKYWQTINIVTMSNNNLD
jgi:release factor glutamine methyltransferase